MINLVKFLVSIDKISRFDKKDIDEGNTPLDVYRLCSCIREVFCLSYAIRKENEFYIFINQNKLFLKLIGRSLRYLGSDERSQALLLLKALEIEQTITYDKWINSTPGIFIKKLITLDSLFLFIKEIDAHILIMDDINPNYKKITDYKINHQDIIILDELKDYNFNRHQIGNFEKVSLPNRYSLENKILYINYQLDQQQLPIL